VTLDTGVHRRQLAFKYIARVFVEWTAHCIDLNDDAEMLFRLIAQLTVGNRTNRAARHKSSTQSYSLTQKTAT
jgi:hypothetical protein